MRGTDRFKAAIPRPHQIESYVTIIGANQQVIELVALDGEVAVDKSANVRRTCTINAADAYGNLIPDSQESILSLTSEIRPYRGIRYAPTVEFPEGEVEVHPLGVFRVTKIDIDDNGQGAPLISISASDRSYVVSRDKFQAPYVIQPGTNVMQAIQDILARTYPDLQYDAISTPLTTTAPRIYDQGDDPWDAVNDLARSLGCEIYFNVDGWVVVAPSLDIEALSAPDFSYIEGNGCAMVDLSRSFTDSPGFNGVIVTGESIGDTLPAVRAEAWDDEPSSATYRLGAYGEVPMFVTDQLVKTVADAQAMADQLLRNQLGFSAQLQVNGVTNSGYEAGDVIRVEREQSNVTGLYALDAFNVPLRGAVQRLTLRQKRQVTDL